MRIGVNFLKVFVMLLLLNVLVCVRTVSAAGDPSPIASENPVEAGETTENSARYGQALLHSLTGDIRIPQATSNVLVELFAGHESELERIVTAHQDLLSEMLGVVIEVLPSLRSLNENGDELHVARKTFTRASTLMERCESFASPELARDLRKAKQFVDARVKPDGPESLVIDLKN